MFGLSLLQHPGRFVHSITLLPVGSVCRCLIQSVFEVSEIERNQRVLTMFYPQQMLSVIIAGFISVKAQVIQPINVTGAAGTQVTLPCQVRNVGLYDSVVWQGSYQEPISVNDRIVAMESMKYEIKQKHSGDWSLTISNLKSSDQARYTCMKGATEVQVVDLWIKAPPRILDQNKTIDSFVGETVMLRCQVTGIPPPQVKWYKEIMDSGETIREDLGITGAYFSLTLTEDSGGIYICQADNGIQPRADRHFRISVELMPIITVSMKQIKQEQGRPTKLQCMVEGHSLGKVKWFYKGRRIVRDDRITFSAHNTSSNVVTYFMAIQSVESGDFGIYTCKVSNNAGSAEAQVELVETLPEIKATRCEKLNNEHCVGILQSNFTLFPNSRGDKTQEEASVTFEQSFVVVKSTCSKYLLPFLCGTYFPPCVNDSIIPLCPYLCDHSQAGCMESFKKYGTTWSYNCIDSYHQLNKSKECLGISGVEKIAPYIKVTDVSDDQVLQKGDKLNLHCNFISNTEYTIKWYKISKNSYISRPEKNEVGSEENYAIGSVKDADAGVYVCEASNTAGVTDSRNITVDVEFAPKVTIQPEVALMTGLDMILKCDVQGNPPPIVTWSKGTRKLPTGRQMHTKYSFTYTLKLADMNVAHLGKYNCSATNILGSDFGITSVKDYGKPMKESKPEFEVISSNSTIKTTSQETQPETQPNRESSTAQIAGEKSRESQAVTNQCQTSYLFFSLLLTIFTMKVLHH